MAKSVTVALPPGKLTLEQTHAVVGEVLNRLGCGGCFSGRDINFVQEVEFFVNVGERVFAPQELSGR